MTEWNSKCELKENIYFLRGFCQDILSGLIPSIAGMYTIPKAQIPCGMWRSTLWRETRDGKGGNTGSCDSSKSPDLPYMALDLRWLPVPMRQQKGPLGQGGGCLPYLHGSPNRWQCPLLLSHLIRHGLHWGMVTVCQDRTGRGLGIGIGSQ